MIRYYRCHGEALLEGFCMPGEGARVGGYIGMTVPLWRLWFSSSLLWDREYKSESLGLERDIIFQQTDQLVEDFSLGKPGIATQEHKKKNQIGFVFLAGLC